ncbi:MAG TPA: BlaI/MecI/CopY family transcriptional regulator [Acidobacteriota bacterium]|nr:BlaI/MecI/CopY family transcriptional regulator [Acidobacteriota bacterium]
MSRQAARLSPLENQVMEVIWERGPSTAQEVRRALESDHPLKESTVRTLLRRMEEKGFLSHSMRGRAYLYRPLVQRPKAAARAARQIVDRLCGGSVEALLVGMVEDEMVNPQELRELVDKLSRREEEPK